MQYADRVIVVDREAEVYADRPSPSISLVLYWLPQLWNLGRAAGWSPLPLTVRDARKFADELRNQIREI